MTIRTAVLFSLFLLLQNTFIHAQGKPSVKWGYFNLLGVDSTWKYKSGPAVPAYFQPDFDDREWKDVKNNFTESLGIFNTDWNGKGIFRKHFRLPDSLKSKKLELILNQCGSSEIYIDGKLISTIGDIANAAKSQIVGQRILPVVLNDSPVHTFAFYYANPIDQSLIRKYWLTGYGVSLYPVDADQVAEANNDGFHHLLISLGIILTFCLFFWCVYAFYPFRRASLFTALSLSNFSLIFLGALLRDFVANDLSGFMIGEKLWETGFSGSYAWYLLILYALYYTNVNWKSWLVAGMMTTSVILIYSSSPYWFTVTQIFTVLYLLETFRIIILGIIRKKTGFWILATGLTISVAGTLTAIFDTFNLFPWYLTTSQTILAVATDLSFPLTLALHLAWEFGSANRDLRIQLAQIKKLSDRTVEQEKEKQTLLSTQNEKLEQQVQERTSALNKSLNELKETQAQLIQSEKMASLGELTAGIAHEIQNPLNFVNNFSEVSYELLDEMNAELKKGDLHEANIIADNLKQNLEKITHHGKRADAIVKGMLQHSRLSSGHKEPTNINSLADEYLRLSYHGLRAKDKSFNAAMKTDFDPSIDSINVVAQDIGRVLLNLYNNAFYAVNQRKKIDPGPYDPLVSVATKKVGDLVLISVRDNGNGIPKGIAEKIFQPFFTTKPTGEGTGLGLSLSYDIVKTHGGDIRVEADEKTGSIFTVQLPV